jgi:hypothetical protein
MKKIALAAAMALIAVAAQAKEKKSDERKKFMSECLKK